eukprot:TRINITY_DN11159_c0_g1_i11.p1 TRINITY_DN11159_c0_g1~~TRINITY_DN11159_c0_g1_i11.p1  ORF type:complete len:466 (-),score=101.55 TRINITY_DN11159_c0_g1_i11:96-1493(-)
MCIRDRYMGYVAQDSRAQNYAPPPPSPGYGQGPLDQQKGTEVPGSKPSGYSDPFGPPRHQVSAPGPGLNYPGQLNPTSLQQTQPAPPPPVQPSANPPMSGQSTSNAGFMIRKIIHADGREEVEVNEQWLAQFNGNIPPAILEHLKAQGVKLPASRQPVEKPQVQAPAPTMTAFGQPGGWRQAEHDNADAESLRQQERFRLEMEAKAKAALQNPAPLYSQPQTQPIRQTAPNPAPAPAPTNLPGETTLADILNKYGGVTSVNFRDPNLPIQPNQVSLAQSRPTLTPVSQTLPTQSAPPYSEALASGVVTERYEDGSWYEGEKHGNMRHGRGKYFYGDGGFYDGQWDNDQMNGFGKLYYQTGRLAYEGQWRDNQFNGRGKMYNEIAQPVTGPLDYRNFDLLQEAWTTYEGDFLNDSKHGQGVWIFANGERFVGPFQDDCVQGQGIFYTINGQTIRGEWRQNKLTAMI